MKRVCSSAICRGLPFILLVAIDVATVGLVSTLNRRSGLRAGVSTLEYYSTARELVNSKVSAEIKKHELNPQIKSLQGTLETEVSTKY